ncbi:NADP-dependent oxidoreductase domain-containing protein [Boletus edulis BED1]|uniref:NADP-dependent oxidoreductase domain-containing protein n=1 Tax=Boletus edulis BED1 TaxID=1328754 RepID=A0AAD4BDY6_BOLED|nr:NADP-dependent oxidoreductase domain-containing protein [Boletus edulis BED1]
MPARRITSPSRWKPESSPKGECFEAIKAGIDALPPGAKMFLNGGEFYGHNLSTANLELIAEFFEGYPDYAERAFLSVKGGLKYMSTEPDSSPENIARSVNLVNEKLRGTKRLDLFQCARVDAKVSVEETIATLAKLKHEGKFDHIGMSECSAETLRRGNKIHPISVVEIEISPFSYEQHTREVIATAKELGVAVAGYSPLGRGFLTGQIKRPEDIAEGDFRRHLPRFQEESMKHNFAIVDALTDIAKKKNVTTAQLCIAWVSSLGPHVIPIPGSSHAKRTLENCAAMDIEFSKAEFEEINQVVEKADVKGQRYPAHFGGLWA